MYTWSLTLCSSYKAILITPIHQAAQSIFLYLFFYPIPWLLQSPPVCSKLHTALSTSSPCVQTQLCRIWCFRAPSSIFHRALWQTSKSIYPRPRDEFPWNGWAMTDRTQFLAVWPVPCFRNCTPPGYSPNLCHKWWYWAVVPSCQYDHWVHLAVFLPIQTVPWIWLAQS